MINIKPNTQSGFSLIQLSIVIIIASIGLAAAAKLATVQFQQDREERLNKSFEDINDLLLGHYTGFETQYDLNGKAEQIQKKRLPCPARRNLAFDHPDFGKEACNNNVTIIESDVIDPTNSSRKLRVMIGALPVKELTLSTEDAFDVFGGQLIYAVSENMTDASNFGRSDMAVIQRRDIDGVSLGLNLPFIVVSAGETGRGTYNKAGALIAPCPTSGNDSENCDNNDIVFLDADIAESETNANNFFDDRIGYDGKFIARASQAVILNFTCPTNEFLSGFNGGQPQCGEAASSGGECSDAEKNGTACYGGVRISCGCDKGGRCEGVWLCGICQDIRCIEGGGSR